MNKDIFVILKDEEKVREIRRIASKYGVRLTSGILISICILLTSGSSYRKSDSTEHREFTGRLSCYKF